MTEFRPRVVIIGAGFGGISTADHLSRLAVDVLIIDRYNFHTFTPLLYQVATAALDPSTVAYPVRGIFRRDRNVGYLMGTVTRIDRAERRLTIQTEAGERVETYDVLVVSAGSQTTYFGNDEAERYTFDLKTVDDAVRLRHHVLSLFERATWVEDEAQRRALTTMIVVGGGPTGVETAGALYELYNHVLTSEYRDSAQSLRAHVILVEALDSILQPYPERLQKAAIRQLESLGGVEVRLGVAVEHVAPDHIVLSNGATIPAYTVAWMAGVRASSLGEMLTDNPRRNGQVPISSYLQLPHDDSVYVIGDMAYLEDDRGKPYPMVIPVAKQQGELVARNIHHSFSNQPLESFAYNDRGNMATIGRRRAIAWIFNRIQLTGFVAWLSWLFLHLVTLMGFRNRITVFISWMWNYLTFDRSVRIILHDEPDEPFEQPLVDAEQKFTVPTLQPE